MTLIYSYSVRSIGFSIQNSDIKKKYTFIFLQPMNNLVLCWYRCYRQHTSSNNNDNDILYVNRTYKMQILHSWVTER